MTIVIDADGTTRMIYADELAGLSGEGEAATLRASHVEPEAGSWWADMSPVGGPRLGPFKLRGEALQAEVQWLNEHGVPVPKGEKKCVT